jgi:peptidyl-prolyl cis-trans isomerase A (cyclophilin A)
MKRKPTRAPIKNESANGIKNTRGTIAMARLKPLDSATSQFFINHKDNKGLDFGGPAGGYAVFAKVVRGMDIVDRIAMVRTTSKGGMADVPVEPIVITSVKVVTK